jgi:hypothetical protein
MMNVQHASGNIINKFHVPIYSLKNQKKSVPILKVNVKKFNVKIQINLDAKIIFIILPIALLILMTMMMIIIINVKVTMEMIKILVKILNQITQPQNVFLTKVKKMGINVLLKQK